MNRANARTPIFLSPDDFDAFERVLEEAVALFHLSRMFWGRVFLLISPQQHKPVDHQRTFR